MRYGFRAAAALGGLALLIALLPARAYNIGDVTIVARIPFEFTAGDRPFPAGPYRFAHPVGSIAAIRLVSADGATTVPLLAVTRLARRRPAAAPEARLVFAKLGSRYFLSEVWLPGLDGFLVRATREKHERVIVEAKD